LLAGPVRAGQIQMTFHHFPMSESGFGLAGYGAVAAAKQDYEWQFIQLFFANQDRAKQTGATQEFLNNIARGIGVGNFNLEQWQNDMKNDDVQQTLEADDKLSAERQFPAQPAVVVGGPNGSKELTESPTLAGIQAAIQQVSG
jgi:hypothetical protein